MYKTGKIDHVPHYKSNGREELSRMKRNLLLIGLLIAVFITFGCAGMGGESKKDEGEDAPLPKYTGQKIKIAIMDFETKVPGYDWRIGRGASDMLTTELVKTKKFRVYERNKIASIMKEQGFQQSGAVDPTTAVRIGKIIGVKYILTGAVTEYGQSQTGVRAGGYVNVGKKGYATAVDVRAISVETGEIVFADSGEAKLKSINVSVMGFGGGEKFNQKKATASMRMAIKDVMKKIYINID
jgi:curli biogenesis system outer membrane secretion channel CsgG